MTSILVDGSGAVLGYSDPLYTPEPPTRVLPAPEGFQESDFDFLVFDNGVLRVDISANLEHIKAARIAVIKQEAQALISATDWKLQRAKEREEAGWASLADVDAILMERECIRRSSNEAEALVKGLGTVAAVEVFQWQPSIAVPSPHRVTHAQFLDALEALGQDVISAILSAVETNPALRKWWTYFDKTQVISASDPRLQAGLQGLEIAGVLPHDGAQAVIDALMSDPG